MWARVYRLRVTAPPAPETLVPLRHPDTVSRVVALAAVAVPPCSVALLSGATGGDPLPAILLSALAAVAALLLIAIARSSRIELTCSGLRNHRLAHDRTIALGRAEKAVLRRIQRPDETSTERQLFLLDGGGRTVFRMSDRWWTEAQIARVASHLGVRVEASDEVLRPSELRRIARHQLSARERHPIAWCAASAVALAAVAIVVAGLSTASL